MVICSQASNCRVPRCMHRCTHRISEECIIQNCVNAAIAVKCIVIEMFDQSNIAEGLFIREKRK
jgi:hypothetical protein